MPELPEVETIARTLAPGVIGRTIAGIELIHRPLVRTGRKRLETMRGRRVLGVRRRGKMLLIELEGARTLVFHLKMTGQFLLAAPADERDKHTRLIIRFADAEDELRFSDVRKFGFMLCLEGEPESSCSELACLGPEPLEISLPDFAGVLQGRRGRIKSLLLDQTRIAGIGNIYADEMLFDARIHPETAADLLTRQAIERLYGSMKKILAQAIASSGSTIQNYRDAEGHKGSFQESHKVYDRTGEPCVACGSPVRMTRVGGRSSHFCPKCQRKRTRRAPN